MPTPSPNNAWPTVLISITQRSIPHSIVGFVFRLVMARITAILKLTGAGRYANGGTMGWHCPMGLEFVCRPALGFGMGSMAQPTEYAYRLVIVGTGPISKPACATMLKLNALTIPTRTP